LLLPLPSNLNTQRIQTVAAPNYQFEKRRRDLDKKAKKEEKRLKRLQNPSGTDSPDSDSDSDSDEPSAEGDTAAQPAEGAVAAEPAAPVEPPPVKRLARLKI